MTEETARIQTEEESSAVAKTEPTNNTTTTADNNNDLLTQVTFLYHHYITPETWHQLQLPLAVAAVAVVVTGHTLTFFWHVVYPLYWLVLRVIAVALGVALGLGFATHVYDQLELWAGQHRRTEGGMAAAAAHSNRRSISRKEETQALLMEHLRGSTTTGFSSPTSSTAVQEQQLVLMSGRQLTKTAPTVIGTHISQSKLISDPGASSYVTLMASAGYEVDSSWKRGQVVRDALPIAYPFCDAPLDQQYAIYLMSQEWPTLPAPIIKELGRFMEFIMRDYVSTWYSMIDVGIPYPECVQRAKDKAACLERGEEWVEPPPPPPPQPRPFPRRMVLSTASTRSLPLLEHIYRSMAIIFGNLSHRVQDVNVFRLVLLQWTKVIAQTFKVYRQLRKALLDKQSVHKIALFEEARGGVGRAIMRRTVNAVKASGTNLHLNANNNNSNNILRDDITFPTSAAAGTAANTVEERYTNNNNNNASDNNQFSDDTTTNTRTAYQPVSEIAMTREFLVTGKLHPACTFGLEIPSLLFADPSGQDCGTGVDDDDNDDDDDNNEQENSVGVQTKQKKKRKKKDEDQVLEERLFQTPLIAECELDYNRVLASRIIKLLIPRQDYGSPIVAALLTEIMGGCVLAPIMSCFSPDYLNDWIQKLFDTSGSSSETETGAPEGDESASNKEAESGNNSRSGENKRATSASSQDSEPIMRTWPDDDDGQHNKATTPTPRVRSFSEEEGEMILEDCFDQDDRKELGELMDLSSNEVGDIDALNKEVAEEFLSPTGASTITSGTANNESTTGDSVNDEDEEDDDDDDMEEDDIILEGATNAGGVYHMIMLLDDALLNLQRNMDLEECRRNSQTDSGVEVNWDDSRCKNAVLRLVLVVEALLLHGRRKNPVHIASSHNKATEEADDNEVEETVEEEFNSGTLTQILMDLTSDIEAFEKLHVKPEDDASDEEGEDEDLDDKYCPTASDLSTLRTLIAAWLHTGQVYRTIRTLVRAKTTVLRPFYHSRAFLRNSHSSAALTQKLKILDGVDVMVDTVAILNSPSIDPEKELLAISEGRNSQQIEGATQQHSSEGSALRSSSESGPATTKKFGFKGLLDKGMQNLNDKKKALGEKVNKDILKGSLKGRNPLNRTPSSENPLPAVPPPTSLAQPRSNRELSSSNVPASAPVPATAPAAPTAPASYSQMQAAMPGGTPRYLDYHRNEAFASSLRSERDRRTQSWIASIQNDTEMIQFVTRIKGATPEDIAFHRELHHVARIFYAGTNIIGIRDAARSSSAGPRQRLNTADSAQSGLSDYSGNDAQSAEVSLLTVEMACARRRIEVPDDDSSFLLRAQPRALNSMGVHRDTRNADQSYRSFAGSFEEPAVLPGSNKYTGGRFVRKCQIRYYPSDRTASVVMLNDGRKLDQRKGKSIVPDTIRFRQSISPGSVPFLSPEFLQQRHLCQKWIPKGSTSRSQPGMLSSNVMEQADFTASPRTGKALDFVYRMSLFECPMIDLGGKRFSVHDSSAQSAHRADASALEMSDAALSAALLVIGRDYAENAETQTDEMSLTSGNVRNKVELGPDGYPIIWMKYSRKQNDGSTTTEIKPYRVSFIRAAMLVTSTRQEAQLQCLFKCVKAGSAKSATKARTDAQLRPTLRLLDFARDRSREKQEKLMRDLKLGINHIDREQLRRNALVSPRYPTVIRNIQVSIERALPAGEANIKIPGNPQSIVFKIRCVATVDLVDEEISQVFLEPYLTKDGKQALTYKETWVIYRAFRDFQALHKHLKSQVAASESSGNAGARLVGAATAAFTAGGAQTNRNRQRKALVPSLGQAGKAGALGVTQRSVAKRMEVLDGYLHHLLSTGHHLSRSPELLMFIGAFYPLAPEVQVGKMPISTLNDPLGRAEMSREVLKFAPSSPPQSLGQAGSAKEKSEPNGSLGHRNVEDNENSQSMIDLQEEENPKSEKILMTNPAIVAKLDKVPLGPVRKRIFELLSCQFGFENASFLRSRMLSALKTMSFAVTTPGEFRKTLYKTHIEQASPEALAYWINYGIEMLWPDGVFFESSPPLTPEQQKKSAERSRELLHSNFPDQLRTVLGQDLTSDGLDILHEMLQNRMVAKSMFYMLFDLLWAEIFPEMKDVLSCGDALDIDIDDEE